MIRLKPTNTIYNNDQKKELDNKSYTNKKNFDNM